MAIESVCECRSSRLTNHHDLLPTAQLEKRKAKSFEHFYMGICSPHPPQKYSLSGHSLKNFGDLRWFNIRGSCYGSSSSQWIEEDPSKENELCTIKLYVIPQLGHIECSASLPTSQNDVRPNCVKKKLSDYGGRLPLVVANPLYIWQWQLHTVAPSPHVFLTYCSYLPTTSWM